MDTRAAITSRALAKVKCSIKPERQERFIALAERAPDYRSLHAMCISEHLYAGASSAEQAASIMGV